MDSAQSPLAEFIRGLHQVQSWSGRLLTHRLDHIEVARLETKASKDMWLDLKADCNLRPKASMISSIRQPRHIKHSPSHSNALEG